MRGTKPIEAVQAELSEAGRLSALSAFAASLAHEINQPLAAIANYAEAARQLASREPASRELGGQLATIEAVLGKLDQQAARVAQIVRDLRARIAQRAQAATGAAPRCTDLARALADAAAVARIGAGAAGGTAVAVELALAPDLPPAAIAPVPLQLVVVELARNACQAMAGRAGSTLTIAARHADGAIAIALSDNGPGVAPEAAATLFQPFKSTRPDGLGIGLAVCKAIIEAHDGRLWYEPGPSGGAVFRFTIPTAAAATNDADAAR